MENNIQKLDAERSLKLLEKGGDSAIKAAGEVFRRGGNSKQHLCCILDKVKGTRLNKREAKIIRAQAERLIMEKFLDEESFLTILNEGSPRARRRATKKYRSEHENISNYLLKRIIFQVPQYCSWAAEKLLKQNPTIEDLGTIEDELERINPRVQNEPWEKHRKRGISVNDACHLIGHAASLAKKTLKYLAQEGKIELLSDDDLRELTLSNEPEIKEWAIRKLIERLKKEQGGLTEKLEGNLKEIELLRQSYKWKLIEKKEEENKRILWKRVDIEAEIKKLEEELEKPQEVKARCPPPQKSKKLGFPFQLFLLS